jgi:hypothetical protein
MSRAYSMNRRCFRLYAAHLHYENVLQIADAKKHIVIEKPAALSLQATIYFPERLCYCNPYLSIFH